MRRPQEVCVAATVGLESARAEPVEAGQAIRVRGLRKTYGAVEAVRAGYVPGGSRRNLDWVAPHSDFGRCGEEMLLLLADAQTSGGLLVAGELPGAPVIGELITRGPSVLIVR